LICAPLGLDIARGVADRRGVPAPGRMKSGLYWRISSWKVRRCLLRDGFVMATAGTDPPWPWGGEKCQLQRENCSSNKVVFLVRSLGTNRKEPVQELTHGRLLRFVVA